MSSGQNGLLKNYHHFYHPHIHLDTTFGAGWFGKKAESFARFFGTPLFLGAQTILVIVWVVANIVGIFHFDQFPFILLNLAFSIQAAYAAPLILLAQTRQAGRDKARAEADAQHRETLAQQNVAWQEAMQQNTDRLLKLLQQNTELTTLTKTLSEHIEELTLELHTHLVQTQGHQSEES